jgi:20S proteasome subunit beta 1
MTREEAEAFVTEALALAMARDASSGGVIRTVTLDKDGAELRWVRPGAVADPLQSVL